MIRQIVKIDREKCNGCGHCIPNCHEGALKIIDGKATLVTELMCDGLGACLGHCPLGAITIEERDADAYNEVATIAAMIPNGANTVTEHLKHLLDHKEFEYARQGVDYLKLHEKELPFDLNSVLKAVYNNNTEDVETVKTKSHTLACGCPGSAERSFVKPVYAPSSPSAKTSMLTHWPIQMHLINPSASHFYGSNLLLAADCAAYAFGDFQSKFLNGKTLAIACPKLDANKEVYISKLIELIDKSMIDTLTVVKMEVPCCNGLLQLAQTALSQCSRKIPIKAVTISVQGDILADEWL